MPKEIFGLKAKGQIDLRRYYAGERLTQRQTILAKCYECCCQYLDGRYNCHVPDCPLYPFMPYKDKEPLNDALAD